MAPVPIPVNPMDCWLEFSQTSEGLLMLLTVGGVFNVVVLLEADDEVR